MAGPGLRGGGEREGGDVVLSVDRSGSFKANGGKGGSHVASSSSSPCMASSWPIFRRKQAAVGAPLKAPEGGPCIGGGGGSGVGHGGPPALPRSLTARDLIARGVGATVGAGIYVLIGTAAREHAGPYLPLSFLLAGLTAGASALCYAELACRCPSAGSAYSYAYAFLGEGPAFLVGWALALEYTVGAAAVRHGPSKSISLTGGRAGGGGGLPREGGEGPREWVPIPPPTFMTIVLRVRVSRGAGPRVALPAKQLPLH